MRHKADVMLEQKQKELAAASNLPLWFVGNVLRWRRKHWLPVFQLDVTEIPRDSPAKGLALGSSQVSKT